MKEKHVEYRMDTPSLSEKNRIIAQGGEEGIIVDVFHSWRSFKLVS